MNSARATACKFRAPPRRINSALPWRSPARSRTHPPPPPPFLSNPAAAGFIQPPPATFLPPSSAAAPETLAHLCHPWVGRERWPRTPSLFRQTKLRGRVAAPAAWWRSIRSTPSYQYQYQYQRGGHGKWGSLLDATPRRRRPPPVGPQDLEGRIVLQIQPILSAPPTSSTTTTTGRGCGRIRLAGCQEEKQRK